MFDQELHSINCQLWAIKTPLVPPSYSLIECLCVIGLFYETFDAYDCYVFSSPWVSKTLLN